MIGLKSLWLAAAILPALATQTGGPAFEAKHLGVGMNVPELTGIDQNGKPFKLSSLRGKVVVLDFFGFW